MIAVIDYGGGNLASVGYALDRLGLEWALVRRARELDRAQSVVFPGVGSAGAAMTRLRAAGLDVALANYLRSGRPYLGICLGLQLLFEESAEDGGTCLGALAGRVVRLATPEKLPHVGWNTIELNGTGGALEGLAGEAFYFTHSYVVEPVSPTVVAARTTHGVPFVSAIAAGPVVGVQFHPERSGSAGLRLLANFATTTQRALADAG
ncbi:MAG: imidazole glycerol phosphate synthase subunit HisH [Candidatus Dormibacteria bacterium]